MVTADPNQVLQTALGGQSPANNFTAAAVAPMLGDSLALQSQFQNFLAGGAPMPVPQQEPPELNIDALRKISDPRIMQMAFQMLMQREEMKARYTVESPNETIARRKLAVIDNLQAKVDAGTATKTEEAMLQKMLGGSALVEIGLGQPASPGERTAIRDYRASLDTLTNLQDLFKKNYTGPVKGRAQGIGGQLGLTSQGFEDFRAASETFKNSVIKQITGAQMSEAEAKRILNQIPLVTDNPTRWQSKWRETKKNIESLYERQLEVIGQSGLRVPGEDDTVRPLSGISDEQLLQMLGGGEK